MLNPITIGLMLMFAFLAGLVVYMLFRGTTIQLIADIIGSAVGVVLTMVLMITINGGNISEWLGYMLLFIGGLVGASIVHILSMIGYPTGNRI